MLVLDERLDPRCFKRGALNVRDSDVSARSDGNKLDPRRGYVE